MATAEPIQAPPLSANKPASVQPGGGWCMAIELAWGRWRRWWLRALRPGYVRRMAEIRQGDCSNCPHDIIDSRDLKYWRNVCGFWFRPEDDRFAWRDRLRLARPGLAEVVVFSFLFSGLTVLFGILGALVHWVLWLPLLVIVLFWFQLFFFFRDPVRIIPTDADAVLSPADGTVTDIGEVNEPDFPGGRAFRISIFLSIFNVHINRMPRTGRVVQLRYFPGCFLDARKAESAAQNEQLWLDLQDRTGPPRLVRVKQISGAIARRIVCWLKNGEVVQVGERFGMIKFGSRTDLLVPAGEALDVQVKVGDRVKGGSTILLRYKDSLT